MLFVVAFPVEYLWLNKLSVHIPFPPPAYELQFSCVWFRYPLNADSAASQRTWKRVKITQRLYKGVSYTKVWAIQSIQHNFRNCLVLESHRNFTWSEKVWTIIYNFTTVRLLIYSPFVCQVFWLRQRDCLLAVSISWPTHKIYTFLGPLGASVYSECIRKVSQAFTQLFSKPPVIKSEHNWAHKTALNRKLMSNNVLLSYKVLTLCCRKDW